MPDFTGMDPSLVASFWIYFLGSFISGVLLGIVVAKLFFKREKNILELENSNWAKKLEQLKMLEKKLADTSEELNCLKREISKSEMYWGDKKLTEQETPGNKALYEIFHPNQED